MSKNRHFSHEEQDQIGRYAGEHLGSIQRFIVIDGAQDVAVLHGDSRRRDTRSSSMISPTVRNRISTPAQENLRISSVE
jgi:hypothetical protein